MSQMAKHVKFNLQPEMHHLHVWNYAYREARKGPWMRIALDRYRFKRRIALIGSNISNVFDKHHRMKIFSQRFASD